MIIETCNVSHEVVHLHSQVVDWKKTVRNTHIPPPSDKTEHVPQSSPQGQTELGAVVEVEVCKLKVKV